MKKWWKSIKSGLNKSSSALTQSISAIFQQKKISCESLEALEETFILADMGAFTAQKLIQILKTHKFYSETDEKAVRQFLASEIEKMLLPYEKRLPMPMEEKKPFVVLVAGVNGGGKTTTIGKLAYYWKSRGYRVRIVAADTFRSAAVEQLALWAEKASVSFTSDEKKEPASLAFEGIKHAQENQEDIVIIDTAGRLPNKLALMDELSKIDRVIQKQHPFYATGEAYERILVLDATLGQHTCIQGELFTKAFAPTGIIMTKLDGTAKGGILLKLTQDFHFPIFGIGIGEKIEDFENFSAASFSTALLGIEE